MYNRVKGFLIELYTYLTMLKFYLTFDNFLACVMIGFNGVFVIMLIEGHNEILTSLDNILLLVFILSFVGSMRYFYKTNSERRKIK